MGQGSSVLDRYSREVIAAVQSNNPRRLYDLFMLATQHKLGAITVLPGQNTQTMVQRIGEVAVTVEEYMKGLAQTTTGNSYVAFDEHTPTVTPATTTGYGNSSNASMFSAASHSSSSTASASSYLSSALSGVTSLFSKSSPTSPYGSLPANPVALPIPVKNNTYGQLVSSSSTAVSSVSHSRPVRPPGGTYQPPVLPAEERQKAAKAAMEATATIAHLHNNKSLATTSTPAVGGSNPSSFQATVIQSPVNYHPSPPMHLQQQSQSPPPPSQTPAALLPSPAAQPQQHNQLHPRTNSLSRSHAEFSPASLPIDINTLWIGSDSLLIYSAKQDQKNIIHLLHQAGAHLEHADMNGWSALHHAAASGSVRSVKTLLDIGADALVKTKLGLTASQVTSHPEIKRELEAEEADRREALEQQMRATLAAHSRGAPLLSSASSSLSSAPFPIGLYEIRVPVEIRAGNRFDVFYRCPDTHSTLDCLCVYYVDSPSKKPYDMRPRMGVNYYIPPYQTAPGDLFAKMTLTTDATKLPPASYRLLYYSATTATFPAASAVFTVIAQPSSSAAAAGTTSSSSSLASWFDPAAWNTSSASAPVDLTQTQASVPIIFHPDFQLLSELTPENIESFLLPVPPYFLFSFTLNAAAVRMALELDPRLSRCRDTLVPHRMVEKQFWQNYFYKMVALDWREQQPFAVNHHQPTPAETQGGQTVQDGPIDHKDETNGNYANNPPYQQTNHTDYPSKPQFELDHAQQYQPTQDTAEAETEQMP